jgi:hypothetical protein
VQLGASALPPVTDGPLAAEHAPAAGEAESGFPWRWAALLAVALAALASLLALRPRRTGFAQVVTLSEEQRQIALRRVEAWLHEGGHGGPGGATLTTGGREAR